MKIKKRIKNMVKSLDVPAEIQSGFYIELYSEKEIVLTGRVDVIELGESVLKLRYFEHRIEICGEKLFIAAYTPDGIRICGKIIKIEFS